MATMTTTPTPGYSGTPLVKKLGIQAGFELHLLRAPADYASLVAPLPAGVRFVPKLSAGTDLVHAFCTWRPELETVLASCRQTLKPGGMLWVSWPKKAAKLPTDITEDVIRELALPLGWVDVKVCAVTEVWSGLKLVLRKALR